VAKYPDGKASDLAYDFEIHSCCEKGATLRQEQWHQMDFLCW
jgi:hypothetical protein